MLGIINPITLVTAALAAGAYAWTRYENVAVESAEKTMDAIRKALGDGRRLASMSKKSLDEEIADTEVLIGANESWAAALRADRTRFNWKDSVAQETKYNADIRRLKTHLIELKGQAARLETEWANSFMTPVEQKRKAIAALDALYIAETEKFAGNQEQQIRLAAEYELKRAELDKKGATRKPASDPNAAAAARIQMEAFRAQLDLMGVAAEQVKVYEMAMNGADDRQLAAAQSSADLKIELDAQARAAKEAGVAQEKAAKDHAKAVEQANQGMQKSAMRAQAIIADVDPIYKAQLAWEDLTALVEAGLLTQEQAGASYEKTFKELDKSGTDAFRSLENAVRGWGNEFTDSMAQMVRTGKLNFSSLADSIINDLLRIQMQKNITDPLIKGATGFLDGLFSGSSTGMAGFSASQLAGPVMASAAGGYDIPSGINPITQLHEREMVLPAEYADAIRGMARSGGSSGGGASVTVNVINQSGAQVRTQERQDGNGGMTLDVIIEQIESGIARNVSRGSGALASTMERSYGLNRAAGAY